MKKFLISAAALAMISAPIAASAQPYGHDRGGQAPVASHVDNGYRDHGGNSTAGPAIAAGIFGFILGAAISSSHQPTYAQDTRYDYGYNGGYDNGYDGGYNYGDGYSQRCRWETQAVQGRWGRVHYEQVQICR